MTTQTLQTLFDLQHFAPNARLQALIDDTMRRYEARTALSDGDVEMLYAAGAPAHAARKPAREEE